MSTQPTDAEIDEFLDSPGNINWVLADKRERFRLFARAVLAKWGQPAQAVVGGQPVYQASYKGGFWQDSSRERHEYLKTPEGSLATDWELRVLYTTPQPTQAQAGAVPLTCEWTHNEDDGF